MTFTSNDPTFESKGDFQAIIFNRTNGSLCIRNSKLTYSDPPPKPWYQKSDWVFYDNIEAHQFNSPIKGSDHYVGAYPFLRVKDRSSAHVETGYTYHFYTELEDCIRFCFKLTGVEGGSVVLPGFALYNITEKPDTWTYIWPTDFQGKWGIQALSYNYVNPYSLSVEYKPLQNSEFTKPSAFIFYFDGALFTALADPGEPTPEGSGKPGCVDILSDPDSYVITDSLK
jgi:hypothetical protein